MSSQFLSHTPVPRTIMTLLVLVSLFPSAFGATFVVNDLGDASDANPGDGIAATSTGVATLRAAIEEANATADLDTIQFNSGVFSTPSTIAVGSRMEVTKAITIQGPGSNLLTITGQDTTQVFCFSNGSGGELSGMSIVHGLATINDYYGGGAIYIDCGNYLYIHHCIFDYNNGEIGGGACVAIGQESVEFDLCLFKNNKTIGMQWFGTGGALYFTEETTATITNCTFGSNRSRSNGGALGFDDESIINVSNCLFASNSCPMNGGAIYGTDSELKVSNSTFRKNVAISSGGGMAITYMLTAFVINSTFQENSAHKNAGALYISKGETIVLNCTIKENSADFDLSGGEYGGGIYVNTSTAFEIGNTIIAGNSDNGSTGQDVYGTVTSLGGNLIGIGDGSTGFTGTNDQVGTTASPIDAKLGPLQDDGGPTLTCLPQDDSPAVNAGLNELITNPPFDGPPFYDQRGQYFLRIRQDIVDIGAVEVQGPPDTTPPTLTLLGDPLVSHECGVPYTDAGATAEDDIDGDITADIQVTGTVDSATPGEYTLTYNVSDSSGNPATPVSRTVTVEDTTSPEITLIGDPLVSHECHTPYTDAGATASDSCDTALPAVNIDTSAVNTDVPGTYTVSFSVTDAAGNSAPLVSRTVQVTDTLPPAITLVGDNPLTIQCLSTYTDPGATASDTCDTALPAVTIDTSALDPNATGTYTVTYSVTDASGNPAPLVSRTVIVEGSCIPPNHTADQNADYVISLSELLRVIQFFNSGGFHCQAATEDGYAPGPGGDQTCAPHASDYNTQDWAIGLSELLRLIQFFNSAGYHVCSGSEDGFCPGVGAE